jgi:hypothetical protein
VDALGEEALAAAEQERIEEQVQLVDEIVLEQGVDELVAAVGGAGQLPEMEAQSAPTVTVRRAA